MCLGACVYVLVCACMLLRVYLRDCVYGVCECVNNPMHVRRDLGDWVPSTAESYSFCSVNRKQRNLFLKFDSGAPECKLYVTTFTVSEGRMCLLKIEPEKT